VVSSLLAGSSDVPRCVAVVALPGSQGTPSRAAGSDSNIRVTWLGHAAFEVISPGGTRILIDPWLIDNPYTPDAFKDTTLWARPDHRPSALLVSHSHGDHARDVPMLARVTGARVVGNGELLRALAIPGPQQLIVNVGNSERIGDVTVHAVPAMHSSDPGGRPLGFVLTFSDGRSLYHTGDTWVFGDMALIEHFYHPTILLWNVGNGPSEAAYGIRRYFHAKVVVPMHYGTKVGPFATEDEVRAAFRGNARLRVLTPGQTVTF
jgi:L-ascorbate metabolism protein UlaG (beta-lactamase superfamily)